MEWNERIYLLNSMKKIGRKMKLKCDLFAMDDVKKLCCCERKNKNVVKLKKKFLATMLSLRAFCLSINRKVLFQCFKKTSPQTHTHTQTCMQ